MQTHSATLLRFCVPVQPAALVLGKPLTALQTAILLATVLLAVCAWPARAEEVTSRAVEQRSRPIVAYKNILMREIDGQTIRADVFRPDDEKNYPLVLMVHGGAWSAGDKWDLLDHAREMAQAGFVAVSINYRLVPKATIDDQLDDCRFALSWAVKHAEEWQVDTARVGLWGYSAGAHLVCLLGLGTSPDARSLPSRPSSVPTSTNHPPHENFSQSAGLAKDAIEVSAVVAGGAPCDFSLVRPGSRFMAFVMGGTQEEIPEVYRRLSPVEHVSAQAPPFFFFHGTSDFLVPISSSRKLHAKLTAAGVESKFHTVEKRGHFLTFMDNPSRRMAIDFLSKHLKEAR